MREFENAIECMKRSDFQTAENILLQITAREPQDFDANHMLAIVCSELNKFELAEKFFKTSLSIDASFPPLYQNYGLFLSKTKRFDKAIEQFNVALHLSPNFAPVYNDRGNALKNLQKLDDAITDYNRSINLAPGVFGFYINRGDAFLKNKQLSAALSDFERAIKLNPSFGDAYSGRGDVFTELKRYDEAFAAYDKALSLKPDLENAWCGRGNVFWNLKRYDEAFAAYDKALSLKPDLENAWCGRGNVFTVLNRYDEALAAYDKALSLKPDLENAWRGRGEVFTELKRYDEAFAAYDKALSIKPDSAAVYTSRAYTLHILTRNNEALNSLDRAIELDPTEAQAHYNRGLVLLTLGDYAEAWEEYEWRKKLPRPHGNRTFAQPALSSLESIEGGTVFLYGEQGLGDHIHFCRYAKLVSDNGAKVVLEAPKPLFHLFKSLDGRLELIEVGQSVPPFDYHCSLMSLPRVFRTTLENVPDKVPYLFAEPNKITAWASKLGTKSKLRIGLVWSGGFRPNQPEVWPINQRRNMPLAQFCPLRDLDADFYSLQKGEPAVSELKELLRSGWNGPAIIDWTDKLNDFSDTAALMENLDLIISVDTSTAHLAGAMAKPVWLLNRFDIEWRWLPNSPWYPTLKLYRQKEADNWDDVIENVKTDLISTLHGTKFPR
jgi:tetratricopeptide (TPR) repeat protein